MPQDINSKRQQLSARLSRKAYRDGFVSGNLSTNIAAQVFCMREKKGWTQSDLAAAAGMKQARISLIENPTKTKENFTLETLKRLASAFDVALVVRFLPFSELAQSVTELDEKTLVPAEQGRSLAATEDVPDSKSDREGPTQTSP